MKPPRPAVLALLLATVPAVVIALRIHDPHNAAPPPGTAGVPPTSSATENEDASTTCASSAPSPLASVPQVSSLCPTLPNGHPRQAPGRSAPGPASSPQAISALPHSVKPQVSPPPPLPTAADEDALLRLLEDAKHETNPATRRERLAAICVHWAAFDPPGAITLALESGLNPLEGALLPNLAQQWAARDFAPAQAWAEKLPVGELRDDVYSRLSYELAAVDPAAAARLLAKMRPAGPAREEATVSVVHAWAQRDAAGARAWVRTLASGPLHQRALAELAALAPGHAGSVK